MGEGHCHRAAFFAHFFSCSKKVGWTKAAAALDSFENWQRIYQATHIKKMPTYLPSHPYRIYHIIYQATHIKKMPVRANLIDAVFVNDLI